PACLPVDCIEAGALDDAVFEIDPDHAEFEKAGNVFGQHTVVVAVSAFKVHGHGGIYCARDSRYDLLDGANRNGFVVSVALRLRTTPATGRDPLSARAQNRFRRASTPRFLQQPRSPFDVEPGKSWFSRPGSFPSPLPGRRRTIKPLRPP